MNKFFKQIFEVAIVMAIPAASLASSADHCPDEFEIVDFGIYESGVIGEGPRTFGGILLNVGKRIKPKRCPSPWAFLRSKRAFRE